MGDTPYTHIYILFKVAKCRAEMMFRDSTNEKV